MKTVKNTAAVSSVSSNVEATAKAEQLLAAGEIKAQAAATKAKRELAPNDIIAKKVAQAIRDGKVHGSEMVDDNGTKTCKLSTDTALIGDFKEWTVDVDGKAAIRRTLTLASGEVVRSAFLDQVTNNVWPKGRATGGSRSNGTGAKALESIMALGL